MLPSACSLGQHFQDIGHSFSLYGPPSRPITYMYMSMDFQRAPTACPRRGASKRYERKCEIHFIVSVVLAQQILAGLGKIAGKRSLVLWIHDEQECTRAWWFETKEYCNEDNKQHEWKPAQYLLPLPLKMRCLTRFQFIWNSDSALNFDWSYWGPSLKKIHRAVFNLRPI